MSNFQFWQAAYKYGWATKDQLKQAVKTESNPGGEITAAQYQEITGEVFQTNPTTPITQTSGIK